MNSRRPTQVNEIVKQTRPGRFLMAVALASALATAPGFAADPGGKPEKTDIVVTYAQPSGAFTPIWVAHEAGLFKKTIGEYAKIEDARTIDGTYDAFAPYRALSLAVRPEAIRGQFSYLDEKEYPNVKTPTHETSTITRLSMR